MQDKAGNTNSRLLRQGFCTLVLFIDKKFAGRYDVHLLEGVLVACSPRKILDFSTSDRASEEMFGQNRL